MLQRSSQSFFLESGPNNVVENTSLVLRPNLERLLQGGHVFGPTVQDGLIFEEEDGTVSRRVQGVEVSRQVEWVKACHGGYRADVVLVFGTVGSEEERRDKG